MTKHKIESRLSEIMKRYQENSSNKVYADDYDSSDVLMEAFGLTQDLKSQNKQFWGRQLGMCWELLVVELFRSGCAEYGPALEIGKDKPCDLVAGSDAIDTKYRVGSGDSGTLKKFKQYGQLLNSKGYRPVLLFVREDNLPSAITACEVGGWHVYTGKQSFQYIFEKTGFDLFAWLENQKKQGLFLIKRD